MFFVHTKNKAGAPFRIRVHNFGTAKGYANMYADEDDIISVWIEQRDISGTLLFTIKRPINNEMGL